MLPGQYKEGGSLHPSLDGGDGVKSQHHLQQQVRWCIHLKRTVLLQSRLLVSAAPVLFTVFKPLQIKVSRPQYGFSSRCIPDHPPRGTDGRADLRWQNHTLAQTSEYQEASSNWQQRRWRWGRWRWKVRKDHHHHDISLQYAHR